MISTLIALPYELARLPLVLVDETLASRLSEASVARVTLERTIGSADKVAGTMLRNRAIAERGADRLERSRTLQVAARRDQEATSLRQQARAIGKEAEEEATAKREAAEERVTEGLREADNLEAKGKQQARATAARTAAAKRSAADQRAESRAAEVEKRKQRAESAADAKRQAAQRKAQGELEEARDTRESAAEDRADAERLTDLTEAKKRQRKQR